MRIVEMAKKPERIHFLTVTIHARLSFTGAAVNLL